MAVAGVAGTEKLGLLAVMQLDVRIRHGMSWRTSRLETRSG